MKKNIYLVLIIFFFYTAILFQFTCCSPTPTGKSVVEGTPRPDSQTEKEISEKAEKLKNLMDNLIKSEKINKEYMGKIAWIKNQIEFSAKTGDFVKVNQYLDKALKMAEIGPVIISELQKGELTELLNVYFNKLNKKFYTYSLPDSLQMHDSLFLDLFTEIIDFETAKNSLNRMIETVDKAKQKEGSSYKDAFLGKLISPKEDGCYFGTWSQDLFHLNFQNHSIKTFENMTGTSVAIEYIDFPWQHWDGTLQDINKPGKFPRFGVPPIVKLNSMAANGIVPALQIHLMDVNVVQWYKDLNKVLPEEKWITIQDIIDGKYDEQLEKIAKHLKDDYGKPLMFETINEFDASFAPISFGKDGKTPYIEVCNPGLMKKYNGFSDFLKKSAQQWTEAKLKHDVKELYTQYGDPAIPDGPERVRDAWKHIHDLFDNLGVTNVTWFAHTGSFYRNPTIPGFITTYRLLPWNQLKYYYPGDNYIDWIGTSCYNEETDNAINGQNIFASLQKWYNEINSSDWKNKPLILHEFSQRDYKYKTNLPKWIEKDMGEYIPKYFKKIKAIFWIIPNMPLETKPEIEAFKTYVGNNSYYNHKPSFNPDHIAPGQIKNLAAKVDKDNNIVLSWTAPGNDGYEGKASYYIVKYRTDPINNSGGITKDFRTEPWRLWSSYETKSVEGAPKPEKSGSGQKMLIKGFSPRKYYFAIQSVDDVPYNSKISKVAEVVVE